jgi:hypothetical protein
MRIRIGIPILLLCLLMTGMVYGQASFARVSGTVQDPSGAIVPGVSVTATNINTGVETKEITNETGIYNFVSLLPGTYKISVSLPGFQTQTLTDLAFGPEQYRHNFTLRVSQTNTTVDVVESGANLLRTSSSSVGEVLSQNQISSLPMVGNDVLDLVRTLSGVSGTGFIGGVGTGEFVTFAGVSSNQVTTVRDGLMVQDVRYPNGVTSATTLNPDLVGEIRLILAPVDAEIGRGNGSVQITTRSGTNRYTGAATWTGRNSAFNANSFENNRDTPRGLVPYSNNHQWTVSFGGPIVRNKTFFYTVYDQTNVRQRSIVTQTALTACARNGVFRYFDYWNNGNANAITTPTGNNPVRAVVDINGAPLTPTTNPATLPTGATGAANGPYTGQLRYVSVFGPLLNTPTAPDCSDAQVSSTQRWDTYRVQKDPTGYIDRLMAFMPPANNFTSGGDGLNVASHRWLRTSRGLDNLFGAGQDAGARKQINVKIDQNFTSNHKANVGVTYERDLSADSQPVWPGTFSGPAFRRPMVITSSFTSTLSGSLVNEARYGLRRSGSNSTSPYDYEPNLEGVTEFLPPAVNGIRVLPRMGSGTGGTAVNFQNIQPLAPNQGLAFSYTLRDKSAIHTFSDNVSWTRSQHSFRFGNELRLVNSTAETNGNGSAFTSLSPIGGNSPGAPVRSNAVDAISSVNPAMQFIRTNDVTRAQNLLSFLAGSLSSVNQWFFMMDPKRTDAFEDYRTFPFRVRELKRKEISTFFKDDWKITRNLTLNLGLRYEYYGVPHIASGLTIAPVGGADSLFGISGRDFSNWLQPRAFGPGTGAFDPNLLTQVHFVGPNSQNPGISAIPHDYNNFGPAIGFAYSLPWFGEGKTSIRGGYQVSYLAGQNAADIETAISNPPGAVVTGTLSPTAGDPDPYIDLTDLGGSIKAPLLVPFNPVQTPPIINHGTGNSYTAYDKNYVTPYVQNLTLSVTRNLTRLLTAEVRYVGTLSKKQLRTENLNTNNFLRNPIFQELDSIRRGTDTTPILSQMFQGINTCFATANCSAQYVDTNGATVNSQFGNIGTTVNGIDQTVAYQMRLNPTFNNSIADGDYAAVMGTLHNYNGNLTGPTGSLGRVMRNSGLFPENYFVANPQFSAANYITNYGHSNYHSMQAQISLRPIGGVGGTATYTWAKNRSLSGDLADPLDRREFTTSGRPHEFRANGTVELPVGPNKLLFGSSSGWVARLIERWQTSFILSMSSGSWSNLSAVNRMYGTGVPDMVYHIDFNKAKEYAWGNERAGNGDLNADFFGGKFLQVPDPQCNVVTTLQSLRQGIGQNSPRCDLQALALIVPAGTPGSFVATNGQSAIIALQNPLPGTRGNLGQQKIKTFGIFGLDASASKTFRVTESKSLQVRVDTTNVLNHPSPGGPNLDINTPNGAFGNVTSKTGGRTFQGQLRLQF